ncbi:MAG: hypothetical protein CMG62_08860 [Candidatus Marinimicrobia bacterium]|nr:hypothetical protein [Candidatus Neomarinimicrobiota bacterium]|tara:strand:- start:5177 stop:5911 length:735 start_codon:yes stop_codon:yes gene_type:complete
MIKKLFVVSTLLCFIPNNILLFGNSDATRIINNTEKKFRSVDSYEVKMTISMSIPAFRLPRKKYHVFFKQPDKIKIESKGFGVLPRTGMFTSPMENFNNLTDIKIINNLKELPKDNITVSGNLILDSLALEMPNDYAKLTFKPTVNVIIDTSKWVITRVTTKIDTLKIMEIQNRYDFVDKGYYLPVESKVEYFVKDARLTKWIKKDIGLFIGDYQNIKGDMVKGLISVIYDNYKVNREIKDSIF